MPPPSFGHWEMPTPFPVFARAFDLMHGGKRVEIPAGAYEVADCGRDYEGRHYPRMGDGYFCLLERNGKRVGWLWQAWLDFYVLEESRRDDAWDPEVIENAEYTGRHRPGDQVTVTSAVRSWRRMNDLQQPGGDGKAHPLERGIYFIEDALVLPDDGVDGVGEVEGLPPCPVVYLLRRKGAVAGCWVPEAFLPGSSVEGE